MALLFQGATKEKSRRGFYGIGAITNLDGKCTVPYGEGGSHNGVNPNNGRAIGVDLKYIRQFEQHILPNIPKGIRFNDSNLQKLVKGGRKGSAQSTVFGIDDHDWRILSKFLDRNLQGKRKVPPANNTGGAGWSEIDPLRKAKIEQAAIKTTTEHYKGYEVESVESKKLGWDLNATKNQVELHLEVKGLSNNRVSIELDSKRVQGSEIEKPRAQDMCRNQCTKQATITCLLLFPENRKVERRK